MLIYTIGYVIDVYIHTKSSTSILLVVSYELLILSQVHFHYYYRCIVWNKISVETDQLASLVNA